MKLCRDCLFFKPCIIGSNDGLCMSAHPDREMGEPSKITGERKWKWQFSSTLRAHRAAGNGRCGPAGKWWEPK